MNKNEYFQFNKTNTFCISLYSNNIRWKKMEERFSQLKMEVTRYRATAPNDIVCHNQFASHLNIGQKCCAFSHMRLWEHILMSGMNYALIIEDDARFNKQWKNKLNDLMDHIDEEWDAIFLNCSDVVEPTFTWKKVNEQYLTGGYIISKKGVAKILSMFSQTIYASDWMTSRLQTLGNCYSYFPWLIVQDGAESTIGSDYNADHRKVLRCLGSIISTPDTVSSEQYLEDNYV